MLRRAALLAIAALILWRAAALGLSSHYAERLRAGDAEAGARALAWNGRQPEALLAQAMALREKDPDGARETLARAFRENPADARPLIALAGMRQAQGDATGAAELLDAAVRLTPADPWIHRQAASLWAAQGDLAKALNHWSQALEADPQVKRQIIPILLVLAEDPRGRAAFGAFTGSPPSWWESFFAELARRALDAEPVRTLYALRRESTRAPVTESERQTYVARLRKDGLIAEAYIEWVNGLGRERREQLGLLYDGGFELEPTNWGFDWHQGGGTQVVIDRARTYGVDGAKALHLLFKRQEHRFSGVHQSLFLDPGSYRLSGRVKTEGLETQGGLKWVVRCLLPEVKDLGESERFLGSNEWRDFGFELQVPESCGLQELRLESAGRRPIEYKISGGAWFDRLAIRRLPALVSPVDSKPTP